MERKKTEKKEERNMDIKDKRDELLLLVAVSGEMPSDWICYAVGSESYAAALLTRLKKDGELLLRKKDGIKGYLLRTKAKRYLLSMYADDVSPYLSGSASTNHIKSEPEKRIRLHRMSMIWVYYHRAGIRIFKSEKPELFPVFHPVNPAQERNLKEKVYSYYGTSEWKLETDKEIKGSRACGILAADQMYLVYNTMDSLMKWAAKTERNLRTRMELRFRKNGYEKFGGAIIMGSQIDMGKRLLESDGGIKGTLFRLDDVYEKVYYIPFSEEANLQLWLLCDLNGQTKLNTFLSGTLKEIRNDCFSLEAGTDQNGKRVYFCYLFELWQIQRIRTQPFYMGGRVFCFTYQAKLLQELLPKSFTIEAIQPEKVCQYLGWEMQRGGIGCGKQLPNGK